MRALPILALALVTAGCEWVNPMMQQPKVKPYRKSVFYPDQIGMRAPPTGTVPAGPPVEVAAVTGRNADGTPVARIPVPVTPELVELGRKRFEVFCAVCHGVLGDGQGMVVQRGLRRAASYHQDRLRAEKVGYFYDVVTNGFGAMQGYAEQIPVRDRWLIVAYVRALQLSQHATMAEVPADRQGALDAAPASTAAAPAEKH